MKINVCYIFGSLMLVSVASSCLLFILGACEEQILKTSQLHTNKTDASWNIASNLEIKTSVQSEETILQETFHDEVVDANTVPTNEKTPHSEKIGLAPSSYVEEATFSVSHKNEGLETKGEKENLSPKITTEVGKGLTDTGQAVILTLAESDSSQMQLQTDSLPVTDNLIELLINNGTHIWPEEVNQSISRDNGDRYVIRAEPKPLNDKDQVGTNIEVETDIDVGLPHVEQAPKEMEPPSNTLAQPPDDIPSFSEWTQKQMEEAEKQKALNISIPSSTGVPLKLHSKNYASPDCGAKIVASNSEALSASAVLSPSRDEYLLNACLNRIWLVIELCDSIQAKKIDIANFELFSSSPKDFSVSVSDRFPSRDWRSVGQFTANDVRDVQSFTLHPHLFGKFVKIEVHSHYGSEHFCPVSLIRVYGTSEFEVLETEDEAHHSASSEADDEDEGLEDSGSTSRNFYSVARDAMKVIVKAAEALVIRGDPVTNVAQNSSYQCVLSTPAHMVICDNCSDTIFSNVFDLLKERGREIYSFVQLPFVNDALRSGPICVTYGIDFGRRRPTTYPRRHDPGDYLASLFPTHYMAALCNALAVVEKKVLMNTSHALSNVSLCNFKTPSTEFEGFIVHPEVTCSVDTSLKETTNTLTFDNTPIPVTSSSSSSSSSTHFSESISPQINPTKTLEKNDNTIAGSTSQSIELLPSELPSVDSIESSTIIPMESIVLDENATTPDVFIESDAGKIQVELIDELIENKADLVTEEDLITDPLESLLSELKELDSSSPSVLSSVTSTMPPQKESVFVRLSNRIKALERNMSLSGQYLEELSRRYKRQVEEMSRTLNRTLAIIEVEAKKREERERLGKADTVDLQVQLNKLTSIVNELYQERDSWQSKVTLVFQHMVIIGIEMLVFVIVWYFMRALPDSKEKDDSNTNLGLKSNKKPVVGKKRRKSVDGVCGHGSPSVRRKRPSEVALNITGTYTDLLITESPMSAVDGVWSVPKVEPKRRRRKKKDLFSKSSSSAILIQKPVARKTSANSCNFDDDVIEEVAVRRSSLSELESVSIPANGVQKSWKEPTVSWRIEELPSDLKSSQPITCVPEDKSTECVINVPKLNESKESISNPYPFIKQENESFKDENVRRLSSPTFMKTALSSRANRRLSEEPSLLAQAKLKSDNWEFWHNSRKSSQKSLVPTTLNDNESQSDQGNGSQNSERKKTAGGLRKIVKRFF